MLVLKDERLVSSSWDGTIKVYNKSNYFVDITIKAHNGNINQITLLDDGNFASCSDDKTIKIWKVEDKNCNEIQKLEGHSGKIFKILQTSKTQLITGSETEIKFWKKENEKWVNDEEFKEIKCESQVVDMVKISDNEIMSYCKNSFDFYQIEKGKEPTKITNFSTSCGWPYNNLMIKMSENILIAGGNSGNSALQIIDLKNRQKIKDVNYQNQISSIVKVSNSIFFAGDEKGNIIRFDYNSSDHNVTSNVIGQVHKKSINCIILDLKGKIISGSEDHNIKIWDSLTMIPLDLLNPENFEIVKKEVEIKEEKSKEIKKKFKEKINNNDLFLCPKCFKNIPLFYSFEIDNNKNIFINYSCYCDKENAIQKISLTELLNSWKNKSFDLGICNSHSVEGKFCPKCNRWLCSDCQTVHEDIKKYHSNLISKIELILNKKCEIHPTKNCVGFCCSCFNEICSVCAGFFNDGHKKYTNEDKYEKICENLDFQSFSDFQNIIKNMKRKILNYRDQQIKKLDNIIETINNIKKNINNEYSQIEKNNNDLINFYSNLFKTFFNCDDIPSHFLNQNVSNFQFNKNFLIIEKENNDTFNEISRATLETLKTCTLFQMSYSPEFKKDEILFELNINNNQNDNIYSIIQLKDKSIAAGLYNNKKVLFFDHNFKKLTENFITTKGYVTFLCEVNQNRIAVATYNPYNIVIYDVSAKKTGVFKELHVFEGHSNRINSVIEINNDYLISGGNDSPYELFAWHVKKDEYRLQQKLSGHQSNVNYIVKLKKDNFFASCSEDKKVIIWNGFSQYTSFGFTYPVKKICALSFDKIVSVDSVRKIFIHNYEKGNHLFSFSSIHSNNINSVISLNDNCIIVGDSENLISVYQPDQYKFTYYKFAYCLHNNTPVNVLLFTENSYLISGDSTGFLKVFHPNENDIILNSKNESKKNSSDEKKFDVFKDSSFVNEDEREMILNWLTEDNNVNNKKFIKTQLIYRASSHGDNPSSFHSYCDNKGPTIMFFNHYSTGYRLGAYTSCSWQSQGDWQNDPTAYLFSLNNKKKFKLKPNVNSALLTNSSYGPYFGSTDIYFNNNGNWRSQNNVSCYNSSYYYGSIKERINVDTTSTQSFSVGDLEVYQIKF